MAVYTLKKTSDIEKKLKILKQQMYGKTPELLKLDQKIRRVDKIGHTHTSASTPPATTASDTTYLYKDLSKIGLFSTLAIGSEFVLFFLLQNGVIKFNF